MMRSHVMQIGPLDGEDGKLFEYIVYPGREGHQQYFAPGEEDAFRAILAEYDADELVCEERLQTAGARHGISSRELSDAARHGLSLFALDRFPEKPMSALSEEMIVHHFLTAAALFIKSEAMAGTEPLRWMQVSVTGTVSFTTHLCVRPGAPDGAVVTMLMGGGEAVGSDVDPAQAMQRRDRLTVSFSKEPALVRDALNRGYELPAIPVPWRFVKGKREPVVDMQLAILTALLAALQHMGPESDWAEASFEIRGVEVNVELEPEEAPPT